VSRPIRSIHLRTQKQAAPYPLNLFVQLACNLLRNNTLQQFFRLMPNLTMPTRPYCNSFVIFTIGTFFTSQKAVAMNILV
jgi:hypothetical protein